MHCKLSHWVFVSYYKSWICSIVLFAKKKKPFLLRGRKCCHLFHLMEIIDFCPITSLLGKSTCSFVNGINLTLNCQWNKTLSCQGFYVRDPMSGIMEISTCQKKQTSLMICPYSYAKTPNARLIWKQTNK